MKLFCIFAVTNKKMNKRFEIIFLEEARSFLKILEQKH